MHYFCNFTFYFIEGIIHCIARYLICNKNDRQKIRSCMGVQLKRKCKKQKNGLKTCFHHNAIKIVYVRIIFQYYIIQFYKSISI